MRVIAIVLVSGILAVLLSGCPGGVCGCGDPPGPTPVELAYCELDATVLDNGGEYATAVNTEAVPRAAIGLELVLRSREELCAAPADLYQSAVSPLAGAHPFASANPFVTAAYACSCPDFGGYDVSVRDTVVGISIRPTTRYSEAYGPGAELADVFRVETDFREYTSVADYVARAPERALVFAASVYEPPVGQSLRLFATESASRTDALAFDIAVALSDGRTIAVRTADFATR